jgi:Serine/threonine protein kinase
MIVHSIPSSLVSLEKSLDEDSKANKRYDNLVLGKLISAGRYSVYQANPKSSEKTYALKIFPYDKGNISLDFLNEVRFMNLKHKNIIPMLHADPEFQLSPESPKVSTILLEYAVFGDFLTLLTSNKIPFEDKLARTYFHQLIEGLEYLHSQGIAHLDIKPENLLLGNDFELKIADFDLSYKIGDAGLRGKGSKSYMAPEVELSICKKPSSS